MTRYAQGTKVPEGRTRDEMEKTLRRYGATAFASAWKGNQTSVQFEFRGRRIRFMIDMPDPTDDRFLLSPTGRSRTAAAGKMESGAAGYQIACMVAVLTTLKAAAEMERGAL